MTQVKNKWDIGATVALITAVLCWSTVALFLRYFTSYIDGWTANGYRYPFAALFYLPWLIVFRKRNKINTRLWRLALLPAGANLAGQCLWAWAPYYIEPGLMGFLVRASVVWSVTGSFFLFKDERSLLVSKRFWTGIALAAAGFVGVIFGGGRVPSGTTLAGIVIVLMSSIFLAVYRLGVRRNLVDVDPRLAFAVIALYTSIGTIVLMVAFGEPQAFYRLTWNILILIAVSSVIGIATAHVLFYFSMQRLGVTISSSVSLSSAFITAILSFFLFGERLTTWQWIAGAVMVTGGGLLLWSQERIRTPVVEPR